MTNTSILQIGLAVLLAASAAWSQSAPAPLAFEVATVKPSAPLDNAAMRAGTAHMGTKIDSSRVDIGTATLFRLVCTAYRLRPYQVSAPDWLKTTAYDIQAKIPNGVSSDKVPEMLQTLLVERFGIKVHSESKDQSVYALIVGPGGPAGIKMKESVAEPPPPPPAPDAPKPQEMSLPTLQGDVRMTRTAQGAAIDMPGGEIDGKIRVSLGSGPGQPPRFHLESSTTMKSFAEMLSTGVVGRPVVDLTGLKGTWEVAVDVSIDDAMNVAKSSVTLLPTGGGGGDGGGNGEKRGDAPGAVLFRPIRFSNLRLDPEPGPETRTTQTAARTLSHRPHRKGPDRQLRIRAQVPR